MPITDTLQNAKRLEAGGLTPEMSPEISTIVEESVQAGQQDLKGFIRDELTGFEQRLRSELKLEIKEVRAELHASMREQMLKFIGVLATLLAIAVAIIKLFPDLN